LKFSDREAVTDGLPFLRLLLNDRDEISFRRIINKPSRGLGDKKVDEIISISPDLHHALSKFVEGSSGKTRSGAEKFLSAWNNGKKALDEGRDLGDIMYNALLETGLLEYYNSEKDEAQKKSRLENLSQLVSVLSGEEGTEDSFAPEYDDGRSSRDRLRIFLENITLDTTVLGNEDPRDKDGVTLITMHNTKGLEYDRVFCVGLEQELIPGRNSDDIKNKEEERRILYVAMTRARRSLYLSYAAQRMMWGHTQYEAPSCFLKEIPEEMLSGDTDKLFKKYSSSSYSSFGFGGTYRANYTSSWKENKNAPISNTPSWAKDLEGLVEKKPEAPVVPSPKRATGFLEGDRVRSSNHGEGSVTEVVKRDEGKTIVTVVFDSGKKMKFVEGHADVERI
ncbi:MAG: 3'-5' exonuclease, partial [Candidatus Ornithospirochaeta sp.]